MRARPDAPCRVESSQLFFLRPRIRAPCRFRIWTQSIMPLHAPRSRFLRRAGLRLAVIAFATLVVSGAATAQQLAPSQSDLGNEPDRGTSRQTVSPGGDSSARQRVSPGGDSSARQRVSPGGDSSARQRVSPGGDSSARQRTTPGGPSSSRRQPIVTPDTDERSPTPQNRAPEVTVPPPQSLPGQATGGK
jgi:hypothetical protein